MKNKTIGKLAILSPFFYYVLHPIKVFADDDIAGKITKGIFGIIDIVKNIANPIAITGVVICGLLTIFGYNMQTITKVKGWLIAILIGLLMINLAEPIVTWMQGLA